MSTEFVDTEESRRKARVGAEIRRLREERGFATQKPFAAKLGTTPGTVSGWETGRSLPDLASLYAIVELLGRDVWPRIIAALHGDAASARPPSGDDEAARLFRAVTLIINSNNELVKTALRTNLEVFVKALKK